MFLEKHEPVQGGFTWFDENGDFIDAEKTQVKAQLLGIKPIKLNPPAPVATYTRNIVRLSHVEVSECK